MFVIGQFDLTKPDDGYKSTPVAAAQFWLSDIRQWRCASAVGDLFFLFSLIADCCLVLQLVRNCCKMFVLYKGVAPLCPIVYTLKSQSCNKEEHLKPTN